MEIQLNKEQKEMGKNLLNKEWRLDNLYKIKNKEGEMVIFKMNKAQAHFNKNKHTRNIILKSRQLGFTTYEAIDMLDDTLFNPNFGALMINYDEPTATEVFDDKVLLAWNNLADELRVLYTVDAKNANTLKFDFGNKQSSKILVKGSGRAGTWQRIHISELGKIAAKFPAKAKEIVSGTIPSAPYNARVDIESTAEGEIGIFHDMFWQAWSRGKPQNPKEFKAHFYSWRWDERDLSNIKVNIPIEEMKHPEYFREYQLKHNLTDREVTYYYQAWTSLEIKDFKLLQQEYPTTPEEAFVSSGFKLFDHEQLALQERETGIRDTGIPDLMVYNDYIPGHAYGIGADVAEGVGQDSSTAVVIDFTASKVVAVYESNRIEADAFGHILKGLGTRYGTAIIGCERNNPGHATIAILKQVYGNIYKMMLPNGKRGRHGWDTNLASKPKMLLDLKTAVDEVLIHIPDSATLEELRTYDKNDIANVRFDDEASAHWDRVIALAIAWQMRTEVDVSATLYAHKNQQMPQEPEQEDPDFDPYAAI